MINNLQHVFMEPMVGWDPNPVGIKTNINGVDIINLDSTHRFNAYLHNDFNHHYKDEIAELVRLRSLLIKDREGNLF